MGGGAHVPAERWEFDTLDVMERCAPAGARGLKITFLFLGKSSFFSAKVYYVTSSKK